MILFCDTSALVKLYVREKSSEIVLERVQAASVVAVSRLAWVEFHATCARRQRELPEDEPALDVAREGLAKDWAHFLVLEANQTAMERAGDFADLFALRAYDAVQLASADILARAADEPIEFACFGKRLNRAAGTLGLQTP